MDKDVKPVDVEKQQQRLVTKKNIFIFRPIVGWAAVGR